MILDGTEPPANDTPGDEELNTSQRKARLRWRCRRGMRELDQAMLAYLEEHWDTASENERGVFEELLDLQEPVLYACVTGKTPAGVPAASNDPHHKHTEVRYKPVIDKISASLVSRNTHSPAT